MIPFRAKIPYDWSAHLDYAGHNTLPLQKPIGACP